MLILSAAVMPGVLVVVPMVIAIIVTFTVTLTRSKDAARHNRHQSQQQAGRCNLTHVRMLLKGGQGSRVTIHAAALKLHVIELDRRYSSALNRDNNKH
jgi:hypothetical protein